MGASIFRFTLDVHKTQSQVSISASQYSTDRRLHIRLMERGIPYEIEDGCFAVFSAIKPDGKPLYNDCAIRNNTIIYDFTKQTTAVQGIVPCQIHLYGADGRILLAPRFQIVVHEAIYDGEAVESSAEYLAMAEYIDHIFESYEWKGEKVFIRYSANESGEDFTEFWTDGQCYIGFATGLEAPESPLAYKWALFAGDITGGGMPTVTVVVDGPTGTASHSSIEIYELEQAGTTVVAVIDGVIYQYSGAISFSDEGDCDTVEFFRTEVNENGTVITEYVLIYDDMNADVTYNESAGGSGSISDEQVAEAVEAYLAEHPIDNTEVTESAEQAAKSAEEAANSATEAAESAESANQSRDEAQTAKTAAQTAQNGAETARDEAETHANAAEQDATAAANSATEAAESAESAASSTQDAKTAQEAAETAKDEAEQQATEATNAAQTATNKATEATNAATAAQNAQAATEALKNEVEEKLANGEFDGTSVTITSIVESDESGGENVVTFSDGNKLTVKNGKDAVTDEPSTYENLVKTSTNENGSLFNGCGYLNNHRLNSSGAVVEQQDACVSGYMPYTHGSIIRATGSPFGNSSANAQYVAVYDGNYSLIASYYTNLLIESYGATWERRSDGLYELSVDTSKISEWSNAVYFRVSFARCIGADLTITSNEAIDTVYRFEGDDISEYESYDIPILYLSGETGGMSKDETVTLNYIYGMSSGTCTLKWQGSSSVAYSKKNYTIKFDTNFEAMDGWGEQKKYCLKANFIDHSHARNLLCAKLWGQMVKTRETANTALNALPNAGAVDGFPIIISMNGKFHGLYTFNIPKDGWMFGMSGTSERQAILCADVNGDGVKFKALADFENDFELEYSSDDASDWVLASINRLIQAVMDSDGSNIETTIAKYLDWDSAIDYMIHTALTTGHDNLVKNYILATYDGDKWFFSAYDMDSTFGLYWDGKTILPAYYAPNFEGMASTNKVFELIWKYKRSQLRDRYNALRATEAPMSEANLAVELGNFSAKIPEVLFADDVRRWPRIPSSASSTSDQIINYYRLRVMLCDEWIKKTDGETELPEQIDPDDQTAAIFAVTNNLAGVTSSNAVTEVTEGDSYSATLSAETILSGLTHGVGNVKVTMAGEDITQAAYSNGVVTIGEVTGDISITAVGYADGCRLSSSGEYKATDYNTATAMIPCENGDTVRIGGDSSVVQWAKSGQYIVAFDSDKVAAAVMIGSGYYYSGDGTFSNMSTTDNVTTITINNENVKYIAVSATAESGIGRSPGADLIVTVNEEIT